MARSVCTRIGNTIEINDVQDIVVTTQELDANGNYVREFRFIGTPEFESQNNPMVLVVRVKSQDEQTIKVTTPNLDM